MPDRVACVKTGRTAGLTSQSAGAVAMSMSSPRRAGDTCDKLGRFWSAEVTVADVVMHVKKGTSRWLKERSPDFAHFDWQDGYGAFSVGRSQREDLVAYIRGQQEHHARMSFQDEFRKLLKVYEIEYDERYV